MHKLFITISLFLCFTACSELDYELTDLEPNLFAADAPAPFVKTGAERASEGLFFYDLRINFSSIYEDLTELQQNNLNGIQIDDRIIDDPSRQFLIIRDAEFGTTVCADVSFITNDGTNSRVVELCHEVD